MPKLLVYFFLQVKWQKYEAKGGKMSFFSADRCLICVKSVVLLSFRRTPNKEQLNRNKQIYFLFCEKAHVVVSASQ
jgi:hypothetical protein